MFFLRPVLVYTDKKRIFFLDFFFYDNHTLPLFPLVGLRQLKYQNHFSYSK